MTEQLLQLIEKIEEQDIQFITDYIQQINKESLEQKFENGNTLLHYVFSCGNQKIISLFASKLNELLDNNNISKSDLIALFHITNDGEFTPVGRILQDVSTSKIEAVLKGLHDHKLLTIFLETKVEDNCTISDIIYKEFSFNEKKSLLKTMKTGILYINNWEDLIYSSLASSEALVSKYELIKSHIYKNTIRIPNHHNNNIKQNSADLALNVLYENYYQKLNTLPTIKSDGIILDLGMISYKFIQCINDINFIVKIFQPHKTADELFSKEDRNLLNIYSRTKSLAADAIMYGTKNPSPGILFLFDDNNYKNLLLKVIINPLINGNQDYLDYTYTFWEMARFVGTVALAFSYGGLAAGALSFTVQGTNEVLDHYIKKGSISKENPVITSVIKPGLALVGQTANIIYSPSFLLKIFELIHLAREACYYYKWYETSFKIDDYQFPILQKYGYSANDILNEMPIAQDNNEETRKNYNEKISNFFYKEHFLSRAKELHCSGQSISEELAQEASAIKNELEYINHLATSFWGRVWANVYNIYKYGTTSNSGYNYFIDKGKSNTEIFYSSFETTELNKIIALSEELKANNITDPDGRMIYPENIQESTIACLESLKNISQCWAYFDFCSIDSVY